MTPRLSHSAKLRRSRHAHAAPVLHAALPAGRIVPITGLPLPPDEAPEFAALPSVSSLPEAAAAVLPAPPQPVLLSRAVPAPSPQPAPVLVRMVPSPPSAFVLPPVEREARIYDKAPSLDSYNARRPYFVVSLAGQFTSMLTGRSSAPYQSTENSVGLLLTSRRYISQHTDLQFHYQYTRFNQSFTGAAGLPSAELPLSLTEVSTSYIFHFGPRPLGRFFLQPFVGGGAGLLHFGAPAQLSSQYRPGLIADAGADIPTRSRHLSFRLQAHMLTYKAPDFGSPGLISGRWDTTVEPAAGVLLHF